MQNFKELYSFDIEIEKEVTKEVERKTWRKNPETKKRETVIVKEEEKVIEKTLYQIALKTPSRSEIEDGDMFYSIQLNQFMKMGLLTKSMVMKQYLSLGSSRGKSDSSMTLADISSVKTTSVFIVDQPPQRILASRGSPSCRLPP